MAFSVGWFPITFSTDCKLKHKREKKIKKKPVCVWGEREWLFFFSLPIYLQRLRAQAAFLSSPDES